MRVLVWVATGLLMCHGLAHAQPLPDREALRRIPLADAIVLDPAGPWDFARYSGDCPYTQISQMDQEEGYPRIVVMTPGKLARWRQHFAICFGPKQYPVVVLTYRATGILPSDEPLLSLGCHKGPDSRSVVPSLTAFRNRDLVADGTVREALGVIDFEEARGVVSGVTVSPHCQGPEPAVFELMGLRFEADGEAPLPNRDESGEVSLQVLDDAGRPVSGATVVIDPERLNAARSGHTDGDGQVALRPVPNPFGQHGIRVSKPGMAATVVDVTPEQGFPPSIRLLPGCRYGGVVVDEDGAPVANASIHLWTYFERDLDAPPPESSPRQPGWHGANMLTDADGRWETPTLPAGEASVQITIEHPGFYCSEGPSGYRVEDLRALRARLVLRRGVRLAGRVLDPAGLPVTDAELSLARSSYDDEPELARTAPDGRFSFPNPERGVRLLVVHCPRLAPAAQTVNLVPDMRDLTIRLGSVATLRGRVVDPAGAPRAGVRVFLAQWRDLNALTWKGETNADGRFAWSAAPLVPVSASFGAPGCVELSGCRLQAGEEEHTIVLPSVPRLSGSVTDAATGDPIPAFALVPGVLNKRDNAPGTYAYWFTNAMLKAENGRYEFPLNYCYADRPVALRVEADGYLPAFVSPVPIGAGERVADVRLQRGEDLAGTVQLPNGQPASGAKVFLLDRAGCLTLADGITCQQSRPTPPVETGPDGRYRFAARHGRGWLVATHPDGYLETATSAKDFVPNLQLRPWGRIEGRLLIGSEPAANRHITLQASGSSGSEDAPYIRHFGGANTGADGRFVIPRVPPGPGLLLAQPVRTLARYDRSPKAAHLRELSVVPGETLRIDLGGTGRPVVGRLAWPDGGAPLCGWRVGLGTLTRADGRRHCFPLPEDGSFRVEDIEAGTYTLVVELRSLIRSNDTEEGRLLARLERIVTVPEMPSGRSDAPLDIGTLAMAPIEPEP